MATKQAKHCDGEVPNEIDIQIYLQNDAEMSKNSLCPTLSR